MIPGQVLQRVSVQLQDLELCELGDGVGQITNVVAGQVQLCQVGQSTQLSLSYVNRFNMVIAMTGQFGKHNSVGRNAKKNERQKMEKLWRKELVSNNI